MVRVEKYLKQTANVLHEGAPNTASRESPEGELLATFQVKQGPGQDLTGHLHASSVTLPDVSVPGAESAPAPSRSEIETELKRLLGSNVFARSPRLRHLLAHIITQWLDGNTNRLDGYNIAIDVFQRDTFFDSGLDPIVRVEMARLRKQLTKFYETEAEDSVIRVEIPKGRYVPVFLRQARAMREPAAQGFVALSVLVLPFTVQEDHRLIPLYDQFLCQLTQERELRVISRSLAVHLAGARGDPLVSQQAGPQFLIEGCASCDGEQYHVILHLSDNVRGYTAWSGRYIATTSSIAETMRNAARDLAKAMHVAAVAH